MFFIDWTYIVLVLPAILIAMIASARVSSVFNTYAKDMSAWGISAAEVTRRLLDANGLSHIAVEKVRGHLTDHYDPRANVIRLSEATYSSASCAAIGVAAHEVGHALQYKESYLPIKIRAAIIPATNIGSKLALPLILIGILFSAFSVYFSYIAYIGVACFALTLIFQLVTLPTEFNASKRALRALEKNNILFEDELPKAKKVLNAAAMTYVAALAVTVAQILRFLIIIASASGRRRD